MRDESEANKKQDEISLCQNKVVTLENLQHG